MPQPLFEEATVLYLAGRPDQAIARLDRLLASATATAETVAPAPSVLGERFAVPPFWPRFTLALVQTEIGDFEGALTALEIADPTSSRPDARALRAYILAKLGDADGARRILSDTDRPADSPPLSNFHRAIVHLALGETDRALDLLEDAARTRSRLVQLLKVEPKLAPLRDDPRFQALLRQLQLDSTPTNLSPPGADRTRAFRTLPMPTRSPFVRAKALG